MNQAILIIILVALAVALCVAVMFAERKQKEKFFVDIKEGKRKSIRHGSSIEWNATGFFVQNQKNPIKGAQMSWQEVKKITAYKRDLFQVDLICLFFERDDKTGVEVHEDTNHWQDFVEALPNVVPGCKPFSAWFFGVSVPAFAPNVTIIFDRTNSAC